MKDDELVISFSITTQLLVIILLVKLLVKLLTNIRATLHYYLCLPVKPISLCLPYYFISKMIIFDFCRCCCGKTLLL